MLSFLSTLAVLAGGASLAAAQTQMQTPPFNLIVLSETNDAINGSSLSACHEGAAIEGLCLGTQLTAANASFTTYNFNYTLYSGSVYNYSIGVPGLLVWTLRGGNFVEEEPMTLYPNTASNVALPLFEPTIGTYVAFDSNDLLNIQAYVDDTTVPVTTGTKAYYRWYACQTYYEGYQYHTLAWVYGEGEPQNPSCEKVDVQRLNVTASAV